MLAAPHEDPELAAASLASAIAALYERDLDAMGAAARRHVEANYSWTRALQGLMTRYQAVVNARRRVSLETALPSPGALQ
jgi:glycosyltransferase involved in cell wall biosynthesis